MAYHSLADIIGFGGAAGGGKTDLVAGLSLNEHKRVLILRREKAQTEGIIQRLGEIVGHTNGFNSQKAIWRIPAGKDPLVEFGGLDNPGDERRWQGRPHDLKALDEVTEMREAQARFVIGWNRTSDPSQRTRVVMTFNPPTTSEGRWVIKFFAPWLDPKHPNPAAPGELRWFTTIGDNQDYEVPDGRPFVLDSEGGFIYDFNPADYRAEDIITAKSRTFIPARVTDNRYYMESGYLSQLQALPEPLRSQMLYGDFAAGIEDDAMQVIPTAWVEAAQARWTRPNKLEPMDSLGVDVARGGRDQTLLARRHGMWFDVPLVHPGATTPDGPKVAGLAIAARRDNAVIHIDVIGVGSSPYDFLNDAGQQVVGVNVSEAATTTDKSGRLRFKNLRSQLWWQMREALDPDNNTGIALPPDSGLLADLCAPTWKLTGSTIYVEGREEIVKRIGRSPDYGSAYILALIDTPKLSTIKALSAKQRRDYDPYA
ncbi:terminase [Alcaligenaceae bacterium]|nr:terminase [Alcaligenaceae bacterium]